MKQFLFFFCLSSLIFAQEQYTLSGFIRESDGSEELIGANIVCEKLRIGTTTNVYGFYSISLPEGTHELRFSFIGYNDKIIELTINEDFRFDVGLDTYSEELTEIILEDDAQQNVRSIEMSVNKLETKAVKQLAAVAGEVDIIKSIQLLPGVTSVGEGANGFNVRGGAVDQNFGKWLVLGKYIWPNNFIGNRHSEEIDYLKQWIIERLSWIDQQIITI